MKFEYLYRTERTVSVIASSEEEANRLVQAELHTDEVIVQGPKNIGEVESCSEPATA